MIRNGRPTNSKAQGGYIKLWRQIRESAVWENSGVLHLWLDLLMRATHKTKKTIVTVAERPHLVELHPGQCVVRMRLLAEDLRMSVNTLRSRLEMLRELGCVELQPTQRYTVVTVCNWKKYQDGEASSVSKNDTLTDTLTDTLADTLADTHNKKYKNTKKGICGEPVATSANATAPPSVDPAKGGGKPNDFETLFWPNYPARNGRKREKPKARKEWAKLSKADREKASKATPTYAAEEDPKYVKDAFRWLRDRSFEDWLEPAEPTPTRSVLATREELEAAGYTVVDDEEGDS